MDDNTYILQYHAQCFKVTFFGRERNDQGCKICYSRSWYKFAKYSDMSPKQLGLTIAANSNMHNKERDLFSGGKSQKEIFTTC